MTPPETLVTSLPMYIRPETSKAHRAFWNLLRDDLRTEGVDAPKALTNDGVGYDFWQRSDLLLSQTCGYPYRTVLKSHVHLVGTPDYGLEGCPPGHYYSVFIVHKDSPFRTLGDLDGRPMAYNDDQSQSGYQGPSAYAASQGCCQTNENSPQIASIT
ncbi:PhnD/SsuA/transferrin family substrate-binding protein [Planktomarina sp.]|nr:PhnD/SsuA/transferrin family substrate-binding protein [Planktomarina sp.]